MISRCSPIVNGIAIISQIHLTCPGPENLLLTRGILTQPHEIVGMIINGSHIICKVVVCYSGFSLLAQKVPQ